MEIDSDESTMEFNLSEIIKSAIKQHREQLFAEGVLSTNQSGPSEKRKRIEVKRPRKKLKKQNGDVHHQLAKTGPIEN